MIPNICVTFPIVGVGVTRMFLLLLLQHCLKTSKPSEALEDTVGELSERDALVFHALIIR